MSVETTPLAQSPFAGSAIRVPKTAEVIAEQIRKRIVRGDLREGDFLPHEGHLMTTFNISRPTLREAFRILEAERLISVVRGSRTGARVHVPHVDSVSRYAGFVLQSQGTTIHDIYEARLAIEPFIAGQLAQQRPQDAVDRLRDEVAALTSLVEDERYVDFMVAIANFHRLLVELGGNRTLLFLYVVLQSVVERHQVEILSRQPKSPSEHRQRSLRGIRSFNRLIDLIEAGDAIEAESHWRLHVTNANATWILPEDAARVIDILD